MTNSNLLGLSLANIKAIVAQDGFSAFYGDPSKALHAQSALPQPVQFGSKYISIF